MNDLKPVRCGCGGEAMLLVNMFDYSIMCKKCGISTDDYDTASEAIEVWNRAMSGVAKNATTERTAMVIEHDASVTDTDGYKYHRSEYLCGDCKKKVLGGDDYCSHCGCKLDWREL